MIWLLCFLCFVGAKAQNSIDRMVTKFSTNNLTTFTTAVKRNPKTKKVEKVVKTLEMQNGLGGDFYEAFRREKKTGSWTDKATYGSRVITLVCEDSRQLRIYMLKGINANFSHYAKVTVIVQPKG